MVALPQEPQYHPFRRLAPIEEPLVIGQNDTGTSALIHALTIMHHLMVNYRPSINIRLPYTPFEFSADRFIAES